MTDQGENPYQPPLPSDESLADSTAESTFVGQLWSGIVTSALLIAFAVCAIIFHSISSGLGVLTLALAMLFFFGLATLIVYKLMRLFQTL